MLYIGGKLVEAVVTSLKDDGSVHTVSYNGTIYDSDGTPGDAAAERWCPGPGALPGIDEEWCRQNCIKGTDGRVE